MTMSDRIRHKSLLNEPFVVMARKSHPAITNKLDLDTYLAQRHVQVSSRRYGPSLVDIELNRRGLNRHVFLRSQHNHSACLVVGHTDMLLTLPERHGRLLNAGLLNKDAMNHVYPFPLETPRLEAHLYWHDSVENDPANRWLREEIENVLAPNPQAPETLCRAARERSQIPKRRPSATVPRVPTRQAPR